MTAIQNIQIVTFRLPTGTIRKIATAALSLAGVALLVLATTVAPGMTYFAVLAISLVVVSLMGAREIKQDADKPQFDIR